MTMTQVRFLRSGRFVDFDVASSREACDSVAAVVSASPPFRKSRRSISGISQLDTAANEVYSRIVKLPAVRTQLCRL